MSSAIQSFEVIHHNPFTLSPLFPAFYRSLPVKPKSLLLSYLVLPMVLYPHSRRFLVGATSRSSMRTLISNRERLYGLAERIYEYRALTNTCIQQVIDVNLIAIADDLSVTAIHGHAPEGSSPDDMIKAAERFGELLAPFDIPTIYRMLGIKRL